METLVQAKTQNTDVETTGCTARYVSAQEALQAVETLRAEAVANGIADMSMEEMDEMPNEETLEAMNECEQIIAHPERYKHYSCSEEMFDDIFEGDDWRV